MLQIIQKKFIFIVFVLLLISCWQEKWNDLINNDNKTKYMISNEINSNDSINLKSNISNEKSVVKNDFIGLSFPPTSNKEFLDLSLSKLNDLWLNKVRIATNWKLREPRKNNFYWTPFDRRINFFYENNIWVLLTIQANWPDWACEQKNKDTCTFKDIEEFRKFIHVLVKRNSNKIQKIQFWNEWDIKFVWNPEIFVKYNNIVYEEAKKYSPNTKVVLWWLSKASLLYKELCLNNTKFNFSKLSLNNNKALKNIDSYMKKNVCVKRKLELLKTLKDVDYVLKNAKYDMLDLHLYDDAENWNIYISSLKNQTIKPIIVSEFGWPNPELELNTDIYQAQRLEIYLKTIKKLDISEAYYFKLLDSLNSYHSKSWLIKKDWKTHKLSYKIFKNFIKDLKD